MSTITVNSKPKETLETDILVLGNSSATAGYIHGLKKKMDEDPAYRNVRVDIFEVLTDQQMAQREAIEYYSQVTFLSELSKITGMPPSAFDEAVNTIYNTVEFYSPNAKIRKNLPENDVVLANILKLDEIIRGEIPDNVHIHSHEQVCHVKYIDDKIKTKGVEADIHYPTRGYAIMKDIEKVRAKLVVDCSGTDSPVLDGLAPYMDTSKVWCHVIACTMVASQPIKEPDNVVIILDKTISKTAGAWAYPRVKTVSDPLWETIKEDVAKSESPLAKEFLKGLKKQDLEGMCADVGLSSMSPYADVFFTEDYLRRQFPAAIHYLPYFKENFYGGLIIGSTLFHKHSPNLQPASKMAGDSWIVVGDAAGQATALIGEGKRPAYHMGIVAALVSLEAILKGDVSEKQLRKPYEKEWWDNYGKYAIWSDLFRHLSGRTFRDKDVDVFFTRIQDTLNDADFYKVLKSEYTFRIVMSMLHWRLLDRYATFTLKKTGDFLAHKLGARQVVSWLT